MHILPTEEQEATATDGPAGPAIVNDEALTPAPEQLGQKAGVGETCTPCIVIKPKLALAIMILYLIYWGSSPHKYIIQNPQETEIDFPCPYRSCRT